jgi:MoaA/NifB/PqqE/SkfB family radical SAM enzyme
MMRKDLVEVGSFFLGQLPRLRAMAILTNGFNTTRTLEVANGILDVMDRDRGPKRHLAVQISLDAIGAEYDTIRGIKHAWTRTHDTVEKLRTLSRMRSNLDLMLHVVVQPQNLHQLSEIEDFSRKYEVPVMFTPAVISDTYFSNADQASNLTFNDEQREFVRQFFLSKKEAYTEAMPFYYRDIAGMLDGAPRSRRCMMGYHHIYVKMNGQVFPCLNSGDHVLGDLTTQTPEEIWRGSQPDAIRRTIRGEFCPTCPSACDNDITTIKEMAIHLSSKFFGR